MKKIISLILSIALLATLMPTILVSAEMGTTTSQRFEITGDTYLAGAEKQNGKWGDAVHGSDATVLWRSNGGSATYPMLFKTSFKNLSIPEGKVIEKVELHISVVNGANFRNTSTIADVYHVTGEWDEATVNSLSFAGTSATLTPQIYNPYTGTHAANGCYAHPDPEQTPPDASISLTYRAMQFLTKMNPTKDGNIIFRVLKPIAVLS